MTESIIFLNILDTNHKTEYIINSKPTLFIHSGVSEINIMQILLIFTPTHTQKTLSLQQESKFNRR